MHVGLAKTGTTYLQRILHAHRDVLRTAGLLYPGKRSGDQFVASVDLRGASSENVSHLNSAGAWDKLADEVRGYSGAAVISHETFARSKRGQVERALSSLGEADVEIVLTLRDLGRQIPAVWQETIKNRSTVSYAEFLEDIFRNPQSGTYKFFWKAQDFRNAIGKWGEPVGMDHVTVVTVPPSGAPRDELWNRFAKAIELPDVSIELPEGAANTSIGPAEAELLRQVNASLPADFPWPRYIKVVKRQFVERRLASRNGGRIVVPPAWHQAVDDRAAEMVEFLESTGVKVVGDLAELTPTLPTADVSGPEDLSQADLMAASGEVIRDLLILPRHPTRGAPPVAHSRFAAVRSWMAGIRARLTRD
jgi:hypothetical protein